MIDLCFVLYCKYAVILFQNALMIIEELAIDIEIVEKEDCIYNGTLYNHEVEVKFLPGEDKPQGKYKCNKY